MRGGRCELDFAGGKHHLATPGGALLRNWRGRGGGGLALRLRPLPEPAPPAAAASKPRRAERARCESPAGLAAELGMLSGQHPLEQRVRQRWLSRGRPPGSGPAWALCARSWGRLTPDAVWPGRFPPLTSPRGRRRGGAGPAAGGAGGPGPGGGGVGVGAGSPAGVGGGGGAESRGWGHRGGSGRPTGR